MMFLHRVIRKYIWTSPDGKTHNQMTYEYTWCTIFQGNWMWYWSQSSGCKN